MLTFSPTKSTSSKLYLNSLPKKKYLKKRLKVPIYTNLDNLDNTHRFQLTIEKKSKILKNILNQ